MLAKETKARVRTGQEKYIQKNTQGNWNNENKGKIEEKGKFEAHILKSKRDVLALKEKVDSLTQITKTQNNRQNGSIDQRIYH